MIPQDHIRHWALGRGVANLIASTGVDSIKPLEHP